MYSESFYYDNIFVWLHCSPLKQDIIASNTVFVVYPIIFWLIAPTYTDSSTTTWFNQVDFFGFTIFLRGVPAKAKYRVKRITKNAKKQQLFLPVGYFEQCQGAADSKCWSQSVFFAVFGMFLQDFDANIGVFEPISKRWSAQSCHCI